MQVGYEVEAEIRNKVHVHVIHNIYYPMAQPHQRPYVTSARSQPLPSTAGGRGGVRVRNLQYPARSATLIKSLFFYKKLTSIGGSTMSSGVRVAIVLTLFWTSVLALPDFRGGIFMARPTGRTEYQVR